MGNRDEWLKSVRGAYYESTGQPITPDDMHEIEKVVDDFLDGGPNNLGENYSAP